MHAKSEVQHDRTKSTHERNKLTKDKLDRLTKKRSPVQTQIQILFQWSKNDR